ncbi:MAG: MFS transporter, partial [Bacteroidales bacterium]|nr:MFS transporter [Bacteroidales bacterium]
MLKEHPKGLLFASLSNMGERFGFYTMMAVLVFFLQARYGMNAAEAGDVYGNFYFGIYAMALIGGFLADRYTGLGRTILTGIFTMFAGYLILAVPGMGVKITYIGLFIIAAGNGLFKGNLQALVGNLYDDKRYSHLRDSGFSIFYMCINIGAFFAPTAAETMLNWIMGKSGFIYQGQLPALCHAYLNGEAGFDLQNFTSLAESSSLSGTVSDLNLFATSYIDTVSASYNYAFGIAGLAMLLSMSVFLIYRKHLAPGDYNTKVAMSKNVTLEEITPKQEKDRMRALVMVFLVVIFFWMSFHQNGLTLNFFARDYTVTSVSRFTNLFFNIYSFLAVIIGIILLYFASVSTTKKKKRLLNLAGSIASFLIAFYFYM